MQPISLSLTEIYHMLQNDTILIIPAPNEGGTQTEGVRGSGTEEDIWA